MVVRQRRNPGPGGQEPPRHGSVFSRKQQDMMLDAQCHQATPLLSEITKSLISVAIATKAWWRRQGAAFVYIVDPGMKS